MIKSTCRRQVNYIKGGGVTWMRKKKSENMSSTRIS